MSDDAADHVPFRPLGAYDYPAVPTQEAVRRWWDIIMDRFRNEEDQPLIAGDELHSAPEKLVDEVAPPPACGPLLDDLQITLDDWLVDPEPADPIRLIVLPPCDDSEILQTWVQGRPQGKAFTRIDPPLREALMDGGTLPDPFKGKSGPIFIPRLERWFIRRVGGLDAVRDLLEAIERYPDKVLIGCNSWAWQFLDKAAQAGMALPEPLMFRQFDADRLFNWFRTMAQSEPSGGKSAVVATIRLPGTAGRVFDDDMEEGGPVEEHFRRIAAESLGIPWIAWNLWRGSLRQGDLNDLGEGAGSTLRDLKDETTLWTSALEQHTLPKTGEQATLMTLHALLIHGGLHAHEIEAVVPFGGHHNTIPLLRRAGLITRHSDNGTGPDGEGRWIVVPSAYPAIRSGLQTAGMPMDRL